MADNRVDERDYLVGQGLGIETVGQNCVVNILMTDGIGVPHHVAFAGKLNYADGIVKLFKRLSPVARPVVEETEVGDEIKI